MPLKKWIKSTNFAIEGVLHAAKNQRHVRYHLISAALVLIISYVLGISKTDFLVISLTVITVLLAEFLNTSIEAVVDLLSPGHHHKAKVAKDVAAGAVLITAFGAAIIGYIVLAPPISKALKEGFHIAKHSIEEVAIAALILVLILVVMTKSYLGKGTPLSGGMPSGHSALAFSIWVTVTYLTGSVTVSVLCFILASFAASSRIASGVHNTWEVIFGGIMGAALTFLLFSIFL